MNALDDEDTTVEEAAPSELNTAACGHSLEFNKDKLEMRYTGTGSHSNDVGAVQANHCAPRQRMLYYFELKVKDAGDQERVTLGFTEKGFKMGRQPGWELNSWGYHGDDGFKFHNQQPGQEYGPKFTTGDTIGAGLHLEKQEIFFTKNGKHLGVAFTNIATIPLYPTIGLHSKNECVEVNFGQKQFCYDIEGLIRAEREQQRAEVDRVQIPVGATHSVVRDYLLHYGYADTLAAFDAAAGLLGAPAERCGTVSSSSGGSSGGDEEAERPGASSGEAAATGLAKRKRSRQLLARGDVDGVTTLLEKAWPRLLWPDGPDNPMAGPVAFHLGCQRFIELIRQNAVEQAVEFAQGTLTRLKGQAREHDAFLHEVVALLAYESPAESPLVHLLGPGQREAVADQVNTAILGAIAAAAAEGGSAGPAEQTAGTAARPQGALERLLRQVASVQSELREAAGGQGEVFSLDDHLGVLRPGLCQRQNPSAVQ